MKRFRNNPLLVIVFTVFIDLLGYGVLIPVVPLLLAKPDSTFYLLPSSATIDQGYIILGWLLGIYPLMMFLAAPILGQLSDRFGRRPILLLSLAGTCASYILFAVGIILKDIPLLFVSRALDGVTGGNISVAQAAIADITEPKNRARNFGLIGAAFGLGFILGPYLGGKLSDPSVASWFNAATPFLFSALLSLANIVSVVFLLPETHSRRPAQLKINWLQSFQNIFQAFKIKSLNTLYAVAFLFQSGFTFFVTFFSVYLINAFRFSTGQIGDFFAFLGLWVAFSQGVITRQVAKYASEVRVLRVSLIAFGLTVFSYFFPNQPWQVYLITPFFAVFIGLTQANLPALISRTVDESCQGEIFGISSSLSALAQTIPAAIAGYVASGINPHAPVVTAGIVILLAAAVFWLKYQTPRKALPTASPLA